MHQHATTASPEDWLQPTWKRLLFAAVLAGFGFILPQEVPLEWYPLNNPGSDINYLEISCASDKDGDVQIFYNLGKGLGQLNSISFPISPTEQTFTYTFPLPDGPITEMRLDPVNQGGRLTIRQMRIINRRNEEIRRFTQDMFRPEHEIAEVAPLPEGWKIITPATAVDPQIRIEPFPPIIPVGMNHRNFLRCLLSSGYLAGMLFIILMAVLTATWRPDSWIDFLAHAGFIAILALLFSTVGNRGLIKNSLSYAAYTPPPVTPGLILEIDLTTSTPTTAQLYWDLGQGFSEALSQKQFYRNLKAHQTLRFPLPPKQIEHLRFDPLVNEGRVDIRAMRLVDVEWRSVAVLPADCLQAENEIARLESKNGAMEIETAPNSQDPTTSFNAAALATINHHLAQMRNGADKDAP